jgi:plastocyanin domain-containing protein
MRRLLTSAALLGLLLAAGSGCARPSGPQEIRVTANEKGFEPATLTVEKGRPAILIVTRTSDATCATEAIFTETGRRYDLPLNQEVRIDLPTDAATTLHYACGMNMYKGEVVVK